MIRLNCLAKLVLKLYIYVYKYCMHVFIHIFIVGWKGSTWNCWFCTIHSVTTCTCTFHTNCIIFHYTCMYSTCIYVYIMRMYYSLNTYNVCVPCRPIECPTCSIQFPRTSLSDHQPHCSHITLPDSVSASLDKVSSSMIWACACNSTEIRSAEWPKQAVVSHRMT